MAASTALRNPNNSTAADFRAWAKFISDALSGGGMTKTADTGQIDLTSVAAPSAINTSSGYEIWQSNDSGTRWYLKIEYGSGGNATYPAIWLTVGWGTDGAGNLTGNTSTRKQLITTAALTSTMVCYAGVGTGRLAFNMFGLGSVGAGSSFSFWFSVERTRGSDGTENAGEVWVMGGWSASSLFSQVVPSTGAVPPQETTPIFATPNATNIVYGGLCGLALLFGQKGGATNPSAVVFGYVSAQISQGGQVSVDVYGSTRNFVAVGQQPALVGSYYVLLRYD